MIEIQDQNNPMVRYYFHTDEEIDDLVMPEIDEQGNTVFEEIDRGSGTIELVMQTRPITPQEAAQKRAERDAAMMEYQ